VKIKKNNGFTLIEMIIVIAILGIVLAIGAPYFTAYRNSANLKEAARDIASDIQLYKQRAASENVRYRITFNAAATPNNYTIARESVLNLNDFAVIGTKQVAFGNPSITMVAAPSFFPGGTAYIDLYPRGTSGNGIVELKHASISSTYKITTSTMGRVHVDY
jgi:prepilin-type N-terminal cleavage/methylation domain-containing protein